MIRFLAASLIAVMLPLKALSMVLILTPDSDRARRIALDLQARIDHPSLISSSYVATADVDMVVAIGRDSFLMADPITSAPIVGTFLSFSDLVTIGSKGPRYLIFSEPSPQQIAQLLVESFPKSRIGVMYDESDEVFMRELAGHLRKTQTSLELVKFSGNPFADIRELRRRGIDSMLITKNKNIFKPDKIGFVLESLFRQQIPVISTSSGLLEAGALVAISPSLKSLIEATARSVNGLLSTPSIRPPPTYYVSDPVVDVNPAMANQFTIEVKRQSP